MGWNVSGSSCNPTIPIWRGESVVWHSFTKVVGVQFHLCTCGHLWGRLGCTQVPSLERYPHFRGSFVHTPMYVAGIAGTVLIREVPLFQR